MPDQPKQRWRPRISVRTFLLLVTLACAYTACWAPTKTRGVKDLRRCYDELEGNWVGPDAKREIIGESVHFSDAEVVAPLIVAANELTSLGVNPQPRRSYYVWFFGYVAKLPYERTMPSSDYPELRFDFQYERNTGRTGNVGQF